MAWEPVILQVFSESIIYPGTIWTAYGSMRVKERVSRKTSLYTQEAQRQEQLHEN